MENQTKVEREPDSGPCQKCGRPVCYCPKCDGVCRKECDPEKWKKFIQILNPDMRKIFTRI